MCIRDSTYPAIARPWGMNFWTPQTGKMGDVSNNAMNYIVTSLFKLIGKDTGTWLSDRLRPNAHR